MSNRVGVFIDVGNQFYCINKKWIGRKLNYTKYLEKAKELGEVVRAFAYGTQVDDVAARFITALHHLGYESKYQQVEKNVWYSWNVGISMDIVRLVINNKVETIVIGNSDRSMAHVITWAKEKGIQVIVIGCGINRDLKTACDRWIEIDEGMLEPAPKEPVSKELVSEEPKPEEPDELKTESISEEINNNVGEEPKIATATE